MKKIHLNFNTVYMGTIIIGIGAMFVLWISEWGSLWIKGIPYIANDVESFYNIAFFDEGEYKVEIDLSDLGSNKGKILFDDGKNRIYVSKVIVHNESDYQVFFRSSGTFNIGGATLVSGIEHARNKNGFIDNFQAKAQATYRGQTYTLHSSGSTGLNYRDGDEFGFYLFPRDEDVDVKFEEENMIEVIISNLYVNLWARKIH